jgi:hypothetical protein
MHLFVLVIEEEWQRGEGGGRRNRCVSMQEWMENHAYVEGTMPKIEGKKQTNVEE